MFRARSTRSLEVVAVFEGTIIDIRHLRPARGVGPGRWMGLGGAVLVCAGIAWFLSLVSGPMSTEGDVAASSTASRVVDEEGLASGLRSPSVGASMALVLLGVTSLAAAAVGSGRALSSYTVGEGADAVLAAPPIDLLTPDAFELARMTPGGAAGLRFPADMTGEIIFEGRRHSLQEWARRGWVVREQGVLGTTLPSEARCRLVHGALEFHVSLVDEPTPTAARSRPDLSFWGTFGGAVTLLSVSLVVALRVAPAPSRTDLASTGPGVPFVAYAQARRAPAPPGAAAAPEAFPEVLPEGGAFPWPAEAEVPPLQPGLVDEPSVGHRGVVAATASEAVAGDPPATRARGARLGSRAAAGSPGRAGALPGLRTMSQAALMARRGEDPIEEARNFGMLAHMDMSPLQQGGGGSANGGHAGAFSPDTDDKAMWQAMKDVDPTESAVGGLGLVGKGRGGGPDAADELARSGETGSRPRGDRVVVEVGRGTGRGTRTASTVRAEVLKHRGALRRCVRRGEPGTLFELELEINAAGVVVRAQVSVSSTKGAAREAGDCIARTARGWSFPKRRGRRNSTVSIPLTVRRP